MLNCMLTNLNKIIYVLKLFLSKLLINIIFLFKIYVITIPGVNLGQYLHSYTDLFIM